MDLNIDESFEIEFFFGEDEKRTGEWVEVSCKIWLHSRADLLSFGILVEGQGLLAVDKVNIVQVRSLP